MRASKLPQLALVALWVLCFGLAAWLDSWFQVWQGNRTQSADALSVLLGDSRRMFANHFFVKADAYFHSGYYPTVFDGRSASLHVAEDAGTVESKDGDDELNFLGEPHDWIDAFSRQFFPSKHTHLDEGGAQGEGGKKVELGGSAEVREIMPWLQMAAELNPHDVRAYTITAFWLRERMGKVAEAEELLRDGLRANPGSYEILYELGRVFAENHNDPTRARNLWLAALKNWRKQEGQEEDPDKFSFIAITSHLAGLEVKQTRYAQALVYMEMWKTMSPTPNEVQKRIDEVRQKIPSEKTNAP